MLPVALALVLATSIPFWALVLWMAKSSVPRCWIRERSWKRWVLLLYWIAATLASAAAGGWVIHDILGPNRRTEQRVVYYASGGQALLASLAITWIVERAKRRGATRVRE